MVNKKSTLEDILEQILATGQVPPDQASQLLYFARPRHSSSHHHFSHSTPVYEANDEDYLEYLHEREEERKNLHKNHKKHQNH